MRRVHCPSAANQAAPPAGLAVRVVANEAIRRDTAQRHNQRAAAITKEASLRCRSKLPEARRNRDFDVKTGDGLGLHQHAGSFGGGGERSVEDKGNSVMTDP